MRAFRIGYIFTLSFLLVLSVVTITLGYFPAPSGPKPPEYPNSSITTGSAFGSGTTTSTDEYTKYQEDKKVYDEQQKTFLQDNIVPYVRNVFVIWIMILVGFVVMGAILMRLGAEIVGSGFAFTGFWAVLFGPFGGMMWFVNSLVSSFGSRAGNEFTADMIFQAVGLTSIAGVVVLTLIGIFLLGKYQLFVAQNKV